jgi:hypothetical protein
LLATAAVLVTYRRDLWWYALLSALLSAVTLILVDGLVSLLAPTYLALYWYPYDSANWLSLLVLGRVPVTEAIFAAAFGMAIGPLYPTLANAVLVHRPSADNEHSHAQRASAAQASAAQASAAQASTGADISAASTPALHAKQ